MTNLEGRVILRRRAVDRRRRVRTDSRCCAALAAALGKRPRSSVRRQPRRCSTSCGARPRGGAGRLLGHHLRAHRPRRRRVLAVPDRRSSGHAAPVCRYVSDAERPRAVSRASSTARRPKSATTTSTRCILTTGRVLAHYQSGTQTRRVAQLDATAPEPLAEMHPLHGARARPDGRRAGDPARPAGGRRPSR